MDSQDKPLPTESNETPEWEEEIVAENKDTARGDMDSGGGREQDGGRQKMEKGEEVKEGRERRELTAASKMNAKKPKAAATKVQAAQGEAPGGNEYILEGFDFSTGTIKSFLVHVDFSYGGYVIINITLGKF